MNLDQQQRLLSEFKQQRLRKVFQFVLFDEQGVILCSDNTLVDLSEQINQSVYTIFPFLESIRDAIENPKTEEEVLFPRLEIPFIDREGIYDYAFRRVRLQGEVFFFWVVQDNTVTNRYLLDMQQQRNDALLNRK